MASKKSKLLYTSSEWNFDTVKRAYEACEEIALEELGLDVYPNQIEVITSEQMLDAYSSIGMPLMYQHWSFGKQFSRDQFSYRKNMSGLAYEIVINCNPCIAYLMEENSMTTQTLVIAHACFGHNHYFKNNYLFKEWTDAEQIHDFLAYAKNFVEKCEEKHGQQEVERILDSCHALMAQGVDRYKRPVPLSVDEKKKKKEEKDRMARESIDYIWERTVSKDVKLQAQSDIDEKERRESLRLPDENILRFIEKYSPVLQPWQREIIQIVRQIAQYFYPQKQTQVGNEGMATYTHYYIMNRLHEKGLISNGHMLEAIKLHTNVITQRNYDEPGFSGFNPYALGFAILKDIERISNTPTPEDQEWFPAFAGKGDHMSVIKDAVANYRDESLIRQFLSPKLMRDFGMMVVENLHDQGDVQIKAIADELGYKKIRNALSQSKNLSQMEPDIQVMDANIKGDRMLHLRHTMNKHRPLRNKQTDEVLSHVYRLWGYGVCMVSHNPITGHDENEVIIR